MDQPMDVLQDFPVRKSKSQKEMFRQAVHSYAERLGYKVTVEQGYFGVQNVLLGDPERAEYLVTAHYDTCARLPFPNLLTPCNFLLFFLWQIILCLILVAPAGILGGLFGGVLAAPQLAVVAAYLLLFLEIALMLVGPANPSNANDNTSGVVTLLETARALPPELRDRVCFVLFDLEEAGLLGSAAYRRAHRTSSTRQLVLNLDCIGDGQEILLVPTKKLLHKSQRLEALQQYCGQQKTHRIILRTRGFTIYPSDQANFPLGLGIAAFRRSKWAGLYLNRIHTPKDTILDENNVALLRDWLIAVVSAQA